MALKMTARSGPGGANSSGQLGLGSTKTGAPRPGRTLAAPGRRLLRLRLHPGPQEGRHPWAWGTNDHGSSLGHPDDKHTPLRPRSTRAALEVVVSCGYFDTLDIRSDGTLWAGGYNPDANAALNDTPRHTPAQVGATAPGRPSPVATSTLWPSDRRQPLGLRRQHGRRVGLGSLDSTSTLMPVGEGEHLTAVSVSGTKLVHSGHQI